MRHRGQLSVGCPFCPLHKIQDLIHSTSVNPRWIEGNERFWYDWETSDGKFFYLADPVAGTKRQIFDNDRIAAELTCITKDPWYGQHLPTRAIRFIDDNMLRFDVQSSQDEEKEEEEIEAGSGNFDVLPAPRIRHPTDPPVNLPPCGSPSGGAYSGQWSGSARYRWPWLSWCSVFRCDPIARMQASAQPSTRLQLADASW